MLNPCGRLLLCVITFFAVFDSVIYRATAADDTRPFSHPDRIRYDGQCLTIDGKDVFIFSGSFHYFRCPKALWSERFEKIKAAGFNCVDTYVPWNVHEIGAPKNLDDFSQVDLRDLEDWLNMAEKAGLYVIIRPGPFICAEWNRGGFPGWLVTKRPAGYDEWSWFRSNDPTYIAWSRHWYRALLPMIAKHQVTRKPPGQPGVIFVFVENEYDHYFKDKHRGEIMVKALAEEALAQGIDVPLATCETDCVDGNQDPLLRHVFNVRNFYPGWNVSQMAGQLEQQHRVQPDAPLMIGEAQGGWFSFVWNTPPIDPDKDNYHEDQTPAQINNLTLFAIQNGVTGLNYYMLFGGTNPGDNSAKDMATSYDFNAPIRECGGVGEKYARVAALGAMLKEHGARLARSHIVDIKSSTDQPDVTVVMRQAADGGRYLFVRTDQHTEARNGMAHVRAGGKEITFDYQLEPLGAKILYLPPGCNDVSQGEWLPKPVPPVQRPAVLPGPIELRQMFCREDPGPVDWKKLPDGSSLNDLGIYDNRLMYYRAKFVVPEKALDGQSGLLARFDYPTLTAGSRAAGHGTGDHVTALLNGRLVGEADQMSGDVCLPANELHAGTNEMLFLYENAGCIKESDWMEKEAGVRGVRLLPPLPADELITGWKMRVIKEPLTNILNLSEETVNGKDVTLEKPVANQITHGQTAIFWTQLNLTSEGIQAGRTGLLLSQAGDYVRVFVNGKEIGDSHSKIVSHTFDMAGAVLSGSNSLVVVVTSADELGHGGLGLAKLTWPESAGIHSNGALEYSDRYAGIAKRWSKTSLDVSKWQSQTIPGESSAANALLTWCRMPFELPAVPKNVWVPWLVRLQATGDGFVYLNGHLIGRYFQDGAQHDYYLPECWLNSAPGSKNVVSACLQPRGKGTSIQAAEIRPYSVYAEVR